MRIYDTIREKNELEFLKSEFKGEICNPNGDIEPYRNMAPYLKAVEHSDMVVFSEYAGHIGRGVFEEIKHAKKKKIPIKLIEKTPVGYKLKNIKRVKIFNKYDWAVGYGKVEV